MRKCRQGYAVILILTALLLFCTGKLFLLFLLAAELVLPVFLEIFLRMDAGKISLELEVKPAGVVGKKTDLSMAIRCRSHLLAAGQLNLVVEYRNRMLGLVREESYTLPLKTRAAAASVPFTPEVCGEEQILIREAVCVDLFGLCRVPVPCPGEKRRVIYPEPLFLQLMAGTMSSGFREGEQYSQARKGTDASEIFDLREYHLGDDVRSIHWKLSSKIDTTIVRESSDTTHYDTVLLFDAGLDAGLENGSENKSENELEKGLENQGRKALSSAVGLGLALSEKLLELGMPHNVEMPVNGRLVDFPVGSRSEHMRVTENWMGMALPPRGGGGLLCFLMENRQERFAKIIYVTAGKFPEQIYSFSGENALTAVCVREDIETVRATKRGNGQLLEIPYRTLQEQKNRIYI